LTLTESGMPTLKISYDAGFKKYRVVYEFNGADGDPVDSDVHSFETKREAFAFADTFDFDNPTAFHKAQSNKKD
jgi:hypothetical protein